MADPNADLLHVLTLTFENSYEGASFAPGDKSVTAYVLRNHKWNGPGSIEHDLRNASTLTEYVSLLRKKNQSTTTDFTPRIYKNQKTFKFSNLLP